MIVAVDAHTGCRGGNQSLAALPALTTAHTIVCLAAQSPIKHCLYCLVQIVDFVQCPYDLVRDYALSIPVLACLGATLLAIAWAYGPSNRRVLFIAFGDCNSRRCNGR